jgi:mannitol-1-phosphate/altronate dehydrogenase
MSALTDYYEAYAAELRQVGREDIAAERARVAAAAAARQADNERVQRLLDARPAWQQAAGYVDVAALRQQEQDEWAQEAARSLRASRGERWRAYVGEHPNSVDRWGQLRDYDSDSPPDWFE